MAQRKVFVREATGLVREWSVFDGLIYDILAITIPVAFAFIFSLVPFTFSGADIVQAAFFGIIVFLPVGLTYAMMAAIMPRSGGDYIFESRGLNGAIGFMNGWAYIFIIDALFVGVDGAIISTSVLSPMLGIVGVSTQNQVLTSASTWFAGTSGTLIVTILVILFSLALNFGGMRLYAKTQRIVMVIGGIGAILTILIFASYTNSQFIAAFNNFAGSYTSNPDLYHSMIDAASKSGFMTPQQTDIGASFMSVTIVAFGFTGIIWSVQNAGEIKNASRLKSQLTQIIGALLIGSVLLIALGFFITRTVGLSFLGAAGYLYFTGNPAYAIPIAPYYTLFALILNSNPIIVIFIVSWNFLWTLYAMANGPLGGARFLLAAAFDRTLPAKFAEVSDRFHVPSFALIAFTVIALILGTLYVLVPSVGTFTLDLIFGIIVMEICTCLAATLIPFKNKLVYEASVVAKYRIGSIPLISVIGATSTILLLWLTYIYATVNALGVNSPPSAIFLVGTYVSGLVVYFVARAYRKRQGLDLDMVFKQIPPE